MSTVPLPVSMCHIHEGKGVKYVFSRNIRLLQESTLFACIYNVFMSGLCYSLIFTSILRKHLPPRVSRLLLFYRINVVPRGKALKVFYSKKDVEDDVI